MEKCNTDKDGELWHCTNCGYTTQLVYCELTSQYECGLCGGKFKLTAAEKKRYFPTQGVA